MSKTKIKFKRIEEVDLTDEQRTILATLVAGYETNGDATHVARGLFDELLFAFPLPKTKKPDPFASRLVLVVEAGATIGRRYGFEDVEPSPSEYTLNESDESLERGVWASPSLI